MSAVEVREIFGKVMQVRSWPSASALLADADLNTRRLVLLLAQSRSYSSVSVDDDGSVMKLGSSAAILI